jgi:peptidoglycan/LPS O-acetylase OafA/YrhL
MKDKSRSIYLEQLTWLRGIAAFLVIVSHSLRATEVKYFSHDMESTLFLFKVFDLGSFGVITFFVLSGCTLYLSNREIAIKNTSAFYLKRVFRIFPAYLFSLFIYILFGYFFSIFYPVEVNVWIEKQYLHDYSFNDILVYMGLLSNIIGPGGLFNNAYWSLPVEFQYYLVFPLIVILIKYFGFIGPITAAILIYFLPRLNIFEIQGNTVFTLAFTFFGGVLLGYMHEKYVFKIGPLVGLMLAILLSTATILLTNGLIALPDYPVISNLWNWYGLFSILLVFLTLNIDVKIPLKASQFLKYYGTISFSTYLYHNLFVAASVLFFLNIYPIQGEFRFIFTLIVTLILSYFAASYSFKYIEKPFIDVSRKMAKKLL